MNSSETTLHISDGSHITLPSRREYSDESTPSQLDVIFVEAPLATRPGKLEQLANLIAVPLLIIAIYTILLGQRLFKIAGLHDANVVEDVADEYDAEIVEVDVNIFNVIAEHRMLWMLVHHGILLLAILTLPNVTNTFQWIPIQMVIYSTFCFASFLIFLAFAAGTLHGRDLQMAYDVMEYSNDKDIQDTLLVIGALHRAGIINRLEDVSWIQIE